MTASVRFDGHAGLVPLNAGTAQENGMEALIAIFVIVCPWLVLDLLAVGHGADSRDPLPDDHHR